MLEHSLAILSTPLASLRTIMWNPFWRAFPKVQHRFHPRRYGLTLWWFHLAVT